MKLLSIMLIVMLLVAFAAPVFADPKGETNDNANWGQEHKACEFVDYTGNVYSDYDVSGYVKMVKGWAEGNDETFGQYINAWLK